MKTTIGILSVVLLVVCFTSQVWALGTEDFGDKPISEQNYLDWPGIMPLLNSQAWVYHSWVNGGEQFYYRADAKSFNDALKKFVAVKTEAHEVLLRPGPGVATSFSGKKIPYNWNLHIVGGISKHLTTLDQGNQIGSKYPMMTVCIGGAIDLTKIEIPNGISTIDLNDLSRRYRQSLASKDKTVRGWGAGELARLDPYNTDNLAAIATLLKDEDEWVQRNAVWAVAKFGKKAEPVLPMLREMLVTKNKQLKDCVEKAIEEIQKAKDMSPAEQEHRLIQKKIREFCNSRKR